jgi:hypothetical protein
MAGLQDFWDVKTHGFLVETGAPAGAIGKENTASRNMFLGSPTRPLSELRATGCSVALFQAFQIANSAYPARHEPPKICCEHDEDFAGPFGNPRRAPAGRPGLRHPSPASQDNDQ